jgi:prophage regulatory protein
MASNEHQLPPTGFVRLPTILAHFPVGRSTWWAGVKSQKYPPALKLGPNITAWKAEHIHALLKSMGEETMPSKKGRGSPENPRGISKNVASSIGPPVSAAAKVLGDSA